MKCQQAGTCAESFTGQEALSRKLEQLGLQELRAVFQPVSLSTKMAVDEEEQQDKSELTPGSAQESMPVDPGP